MLFLQLFQQKLLQCLLVGQLKHIGRNEEVVIHAGERVLHHLFAFACAEQDADWRVVARLHLVLAIMRYVCVELSEVLVGELLVLQFYDYAAMQYAVVEHKVGIVIFVVDDDAFLASLEAEALAEFEDELGASLMHQLYLLYFQWVVIGASLSHKLGWINFPSFEDIIYRTFLPI